MNKKQKKILYRIIVAAIMLIVLQLLQLNNITNYFLYLIIYIIIGYDILYKSYRGILNRRIFDENFLMSIATIGAILLAIYTKSGEFTEAIAVMLFYQIGELFQSYAVRKSRKSISELMNIRPDYANIEVNGKLEQVTPKEIKIGEIIIVKAGEKVPLDGIVLEGISEINTTALTGESIPVNVSSGDNIISGSINLTGLLKIKTTKTYEESTVSKILNLIENAGSKKSHSEHFISKFAKIYTPIVCYLALTLALLPPIIRILFLNLPAETEVWLYRALTFLVISCPCALVISIPLTFFAGLGGASKEGILIKGANYIETLAKTKYVVFDKTGTLTQGIFEISAIHHNIIDKKRLIELAATAECASNHPISRSLVSACENEIDRNRVTNIQEISGNGIIAYIDGKKIIVGNNKLMSLQNINFIECQSDGTIVHVAEENEYLGHIVISDIIKQTSYTAIKQLRSNGIERIIMLTGDKMKVAKNVAEELGIKEFYAELLPEAKVNKLQEFISNKSKNKKLAFVGDGINDAPVLSIADVGIAMGAIGSDAAIEAADVVLMDDNPIKIPKAIQISKKCMKIVCQNITLALSVKSACLILGAIGIANMWLAIFADVGIMVIAVLNALRAFYIK